MSDLHERLHEDVAAYALDALDPGARGRVEAHLATCDACRQDLAEYRRVLGVLPLALQPEVPPAGARERLLARARVPGRGEQAGHAPTPDGHVSDRPVARVPGPRQAADGGPARDVAADDPAHVVRRRRSAFASLRRSLALVALLAALLAGSLLWSALQGPGPRATVGTEILAWLPGGRILALDGTGQPTASARLYVVGGGDRAELAVAGLPPLPPERVYQLWFARPGQPTVTGGTFRVDARGEAVASVSIPVALAQASAIAVTEEPAPGSPGPTGAHLLDWVPGAPPAS